MSVFFTSDTHFGHANIISLCNRPFQTVEHMDEAMIERWNEAVKPNDDVWHLGDFAWGDAPEQYFDRLNGRKHLVSGNHDGFAVKNLGWATVNTYCRFKFNRRRFVLFHYPILEWDGFYKGAAHFHGHQHNKEAFRDRRRVDVGVDAHDFRPWPIEDLILFLDAMEEKA